MKGCSAPEFWTLAGAPGRHFAHKSLAQQFSPMCFDPLLANIFLHEVLDAWFEEVVRPRMRGQVRLVRYADDAVFVFARKDDAERVMAVLPRRFEKYGDRRQLLLPVDDNYSCRSRPAGNQ